MNPFATRILRRPGMRPGTAAVPRSRFARLRALAARAVGVTIAVGGVTGAWFWLTRTDVFAVKTISIEGTSAERSEEIRAILNLPTRDGASGGGTGFTSLLFLDLSATRAHVESHPWVASAVVKRELPDTLRIVVSEREPKLILALDRLYYVDALGTPFKAIQPGERYDLPVLTGVSRDEVLNKGEKARAAIKGALSLAEALSAKDAAGAITLDDVSEIRFDPARGFSVVSMRGNERVRFGFPGAAARWSDGKGEARPGADDWGEKLARLKEVRAQPGGKGESVRTIDLSFSERVVVSRS